jgi:hypothetical protein
VNYVRFENWLHRKPASAKFRLCHSTTRSVCGDKKRRFLNKAIPVKSFQAQQQSRLDVFFETQFLRICFVLFETKKNVLFAINLVTPNAFDLKL